MSLQKKKILVTRPRQQAEKLAQIISANDGEAIVFPVIEIKPLARSEVITECFNKVNQYNMLIFISRNAVEVTFNSYLTDTDLSEEIQLLAIGASTAEAMRVSGRYNVLHAGKQADTESLLERQELQTTQISGKKILIVRATGGRGLLAKTLRERGAEVNYIEVYQRCLPAYEAGYLEHLWHDLKPDIAIITSRDGLRNLVKLTLPNYHQALFNIPLVLMSERIAGLAQELGFISKLNIVDNKNNQGLMSALHNIVGE